MDYYFSRERNWGLLNLELLYFNFLHASIFFRSFRYAQNQFLLKSEFSTRKILNSGSLLVWFSLSSASMFIDLIN